MLHQVGLGLPARLQRASKGNHDGGTLDLVFARRYSLAGEQFADQSNRISSHARILREGEAVLQKASRPSARCQ